jgi:hypothetical protein
VSEVQRHSPTARRRIPWLAVIALLILTTGTAVASSRTHSLDLFADPSGVVGPSSGVGWGGTGAPLGAETRLWVTGFFYGNGTSPVPVRVTRVALVPIAGMATPRMVGWRVYVVSRHCCATNGNEVGPWPVGREGSFAVYRGVAPPGSWVTMQPLRTTVRPFYGLDVVVSLAASRHTREFGVWGVVVTYVERDFTVHTQTSNEGYVFCRAKRAGEAIDWSACPNPYFPS